jgi:hypothetical protein
MWLCVITGNEPTAYLLFLYSAKCLLYVDKNSSLKTKQYSWAWWLTPVILATQEAEIRRIMV